jgi:excisionase family DNA binding protein
MDRESDLLTVEEAATFLRTSKGAIFQWRRRGQAPRALKVGAKLLFRREDLVEWLESRAEEKVAVG